MEDEQRLANNHQLPGGTASLFRQAVPKIIAAEGPNAVRRFLEFFTANIRNKNTRAAYAQAVGQFCRWCDRRRFSLELIEPITVAAYIEELLRIRSKPTVKQHLAAIRMLFDWLVLGQIIPANPAGVVRGPSHVVKRGKTPVLSADDARKLLDSISLTPYCPKTRTTRKRNGCEQVCCNAGFDFLAPSIRSPRSIERGR